MVKTAIAQLDEVRNTNELDELVKQTLGEELYAKTSSYTYLEMSRLPECRPFRAFLKSAEDRWYNFS